MKRKPSAVMFLLEDGDIICRECWFPGDDLEKDLLVGDTYADDPCDRCGRKHTDGVNQEKRLGEVVAEGLRDFVAGPFGCRCTTLQQRVVGDGCDMCTNELGDPQP